MIAMTDYFEININFKDRTGKVKIPMWLLDGETNGTEDRRLVIHASIVRIMKEHKTGNYKDLESKCAQQLGRTFNP